MPFNISAHLRAFHLVDELWWSLSVWIKAPKKRKCNCRQIAEHRGSGSAMTCTPLDYITTQVFARYIISSGLLAGDEIWKPPTVLEIPSKKPAVLLSFVAAWTDVLSLGIHKLLKKQVSINSITYSHIYIPWDFCWGLKFTNMNNNTCPTDCNSIIFMSFCASEDSQRLEKPFYPRVI